MSLVKSFSYNVNNFDLIRLFAALQVALTHTAHYLGVESIVIDVLSYIPGVPIFFFISGFLVYRSYCNIEFSKLRVFFTNRALRIYPGLLGCLVFTLVSVYFSGFLYNKPPEAYEIFRWFLADLTFFQFYNPDFLREYGTGAVNGSLWTISVELQFYFLVPILFILLKAGWRLTIAALVFFIILNIVNLAFNVGDSIFWRLFEVSFMPWVSMFLVGVVVSANRLLLDRLLSFNFFACLFLYVILYFLSDKYNLGVGNKVNIILYMLLVVLILHAAYRAPCVSNSLIGQNDISYGIYIYHMPIVNFFVYVGAFSDVLAFSYAMIATLIFSLISWFLIEKPMLKFKKRALRRHA